MIEKYKKEQTEILITNISSDIDDSLRKKIMDYRLVTSVFHNKKLILKYISKEKLKLSESINSVTYKSRRGIDQYLEYLLKDPYNDYLRRDAVETFIISSIFGAYKHKSGINFLDPKMYREVQELDPIKSFIQRAILLEYSFFLTDEIDKVKQIKKTKGEKIPQKNSNSSILKWIGGKTSLTELIKALIENGNIKIEKEGVISNEKNQKVIFESLTNILNFNISKPDKFVQNIKNRNNDVTTKFLDSLSSRLKEYFNKKEKNNKEEDNSEENIYQKNSNISNLKWVGKDIELAELIKALIENGNIKIEKEGVISNKKNQKAIFESLTDILNFKIQSPNKLIQEIKANNKTPFIDTLSLTLKRYFNEKN
ncbi:RteC domain-containing protein [Tenacibaculum sp. AHE15PA]|uniref:RteC domain-containing protein n=1 Tax=unclassified Tenacibaculum TaxID=2635139 RepID=UPI001C500F56|nr:MULTISPECIES: RteC domain-containing protein [unclassified Tenacibaculum]QXP72516.1 RteC domain-containing protein [Tenacibaculum sp. AHE14PA]QXP76431.1 RteC domain-containing protein [Tenacibaculum sp. AHE15PA]